MKKTKKIIVAMMSAMVLSTLAPTVYAATPSESVKITREYFADGSYIETKIVESNARSTVKNASKTSTYKNASGVLCINHHGVFIIFYPWSLFSFYALPRVLRAVFS